MQNHPSPRSRKKRREGAHRSFLSRRIFLSMNPRQRVFLLGASKPIVWLACVTRVLGEVLRMQNYPSPRSRKKRREGAHRSFLSTRIFLSMNPRQRVFLLGASKPIVWLACVTRVSGEVLRMQNYPSPRSCFKQLRFLSHIQPFVSLDKLISSLESTSCLLFSKNSD